MYIFTQWLCIYNRLRLSVIGFIHFFFLISQTPTSPVFRPMASLIIQGKQDQCCSLLCPENSMITIFQQVLVQMHGHHHPLNKWSSALFSPENTASVPSHHEWHRPMWAKEAVGLWISCLQGMGSKSLFIAKNILRLEMPSS